MVCNENDEGPFPILNILKVSTEPTRLGWGLIYDIIYLDQKNGEMAVRQGNLAQLSCRETNGKSKDFLINN